LLLLEAAVADLAKTVKEYGSGKRIPGFALVQSIASLRLLSDADRRTQGCAQQSICV
jgi:hypothetical protein